MSRKKNQHFTDNKDKKVRKRKETRFVAAAAACVIGAGTILGGAGMSVRADSDPKVKEGTTVVSFGEDLTDSQKSTVMDLLGVTNSDLQEDKVLTVSNEDEHEYLDSYLSSDVIGTKALSSAKVTAKGNGYGIQVTEKNINYCTVLMYQNALATAGLENADVVVAAPFQISGTAALIGAMKAYSEMTGTEISDDNADAATNELVVTSELGDETGDQEGAENLVAAVKEKVVSEGTTDHDTIINFINETSNELNINLTNDQKEEIYNLMVKIEGLHLDPDTLVQQASGIYEKLQSMGIDMNSAEAQNFFQRIIAFFKNLFSQITGG